jgi:hypothetical protein
VLGPLLAEGAPPQIVQSRDGADARSEDATDEGGKNVASRGRIHLRLDNGVGRRRPPWVCAHAILGAHLARVTRAAEAHAAIVTAVAVVARRLAALAALAVLPVGRKEGESSAQEGSKPELSGAR